jgi:peptidoglycan hydrolase-like protein with peptidoglycan-binding domain
MSTYDGGYPDANRGAFTMMGLGTMGQIGAPFAYVPDLAPVGSQSAYFPRSVASDANALNFLGFLGDNELASLRPSTGSQSGDMNGPAGAWAPAFRAAITRFQVSRGLTNDSWVGPATRTALLAAVTAKNLQQPLPPVLPPSVPVPVLPGAVPAAPAVLPGVLPAAKPADDDTLLYAGAGVGAVLLLGLGYWALK